MRTQDKPRSITEITAELEKKTAKHKEAEKVESHARSISTRLLNEVSDLQRELDQAIGTLKKSAPWSSKWGSDQREQINKDL